MTFKLIGGVDFSGAKEVPNQTWLALGRLGNLGLEIFELTRVGSHSLAQELNKQSGLAVVGLDVPFSLPAPFLTFLANKQQKKDFQSWQEVAETLVFMAFDEFVETVKEYKKEPRRFTDTTDGSTAISPMHRGNPSMVQMTYQGIRLLSSLNPELFYVLPFQNVIPLGCAVLEVYPRDTLKYLGVTDSGYKSQEKKDSEKMHDLRRKMLKDLTELREKKGITFKEFPRLSINKQIEHFAIESDHALDAIVACYTSALYVALPKLFADPFASDNLEVLLEGWIYRIA